MISAEYCQMMARYNRWMNERLYKICAGIEDTERKRDQGAFFKSIHGTLNHILYGDLAFMSRFTGEPPKAPEIGIDLYESFLELTQARQALDTRIEAWTTTLTEKWLGDLLTYTSKVDGKDRTFPHWVIVSHMFNHETHHRGQVTTLLSQMGLDIGSTDIPFMPQFEV